MPRASSRWPTTAPATTCSGSSPRPGRSSRRTAFTAREASPSGSARAASPSLPTVTSPACCSAARTGADLDQSPDRSGHARPPCPRTGPFGRSLAQRPLVGGTYGVVLGRAFFAESMFSRATDASKVALAFLMARLKVGEFHLVRLPVPDRPPRLPGRGGSAANATSGCSASAPLGPRPAAARLDLVGRAAVVATAFPLPLDAAGKLIVQLLGQTS